MNSKVDVISQHSLILSLDEVPEGLKYHPGTFFRLENLKDFDKELKEMFNKHKVLVKIDSYCLSCDGEIMYSIEVVNPKNIDFKWILSDEDLESSFICLGKDVDKLRLENIL